MNKREIINSIFLSFEEKNVRYAIVRGFLPIESIYNTKDIDVFILKKDLGIAKYELTKLGFRSPHINANQYPHIQFFRLTTEGLIKIDIVTSICFGEHLLGGIVQEDDYYHITTELGGIRVFRYDVALKFLLLHIVYDKSNVSIENKERVILLNHYLNETLDLDDCLMSLNESIIHNSIDEANINVQLFKQNYSPRLQPVPLSRWYRLRTRIAVALRYRLHRLRNKSIAFIGVDGSGKSTIVKKTNLLLNDSSRVQYMGFREMETKFGLWYTNPQKEVFGYRIRTKLFLGIYIEMWYRYLKYRFDSYRLLLFDRYPWEAYDNAEGKYKLPYFLLFKVLFPHPKRVYYLYCNADTSLRRKDDIQDEERFRQMKLHFDKKYKRIAAMSFDTDINNPNMILERICEDIMECGLYEFLF